MVKDTNSNVVTLGKDSMGSVKIADQVVGIIAAYAATEVDGVACMAGNITSNILNRVGMKTLAKGVKVLVDEQKVRVIVSLIVKYGIEIPTVSANVQSRVKTAIESMTGLSVTDVNVRIAGVANPQEV